MDSLALIIHLIVIYIVGEGNNNIISFCGCTRKSENTIEKCNYLLLDQSVLNAVLN